MPSRPGSTTSGDQSTHSSNAQNEIEKAGYLQKWTNYLKGYRMRWFVLDSDSVLSYYRERRYGKIHRSTTGKVVMNFHETAEHCRFGGPPSGGGIRASRERSAAACISSADSMHAEGGGHDKISDADGHKKRMTNLRGRLRKAKKRFSGCNFPLSRRRKCSTDDVYYSAVDDYRNPQEVGQSCRGSINLQEARILSDKLANNIVISAQSQTFHLKAQNDIDRQKWLQALEYSRHNAIKQAESDEDEEAHRKPDESRAESLQNLNKSLVVKLEDLHAAVSLLDKHGDELIRCVGELDIDRKTLSERAALFKITTSAVVKAAEEFVDYSDRGARRLKKVVATEQKEKLLLQEQLETLAKQHSSLERAATVSHSNAPLSAYSDQEDDFQDAVEELSICGDRKSSRANSHDGGDEMQRTSAHPSVAGSSGSRAPENHGRVRRSRVPERPDLPLNLWSIMKNCIGKELSKIPMPVNFSEPLSVLQRITEDLEYANLLDAAVSRDPLVQLCYVAAYGVSNYSTTGNRTNKPFNPLLGETYECDRMADRGWRSVTEQVSHHPPAAAHHAEGRGWTMFQDFTMTSRFRGKYLSVIPVGMTHVRFSGTNAKFSYKKVTTTVHNIIVGKLWIDNHGEMEINNHTTGDKCTVKFVPYSYFSKETPRKIYGIVKDSSGKPHYVVQGTWDKHVDMLKVVKYTGTGDKMKVETDENPVRLWTCNAPYPGSEKMHNFTKFAIELNEPEEGVAPTDSRIRPDQRLMEEGKWEESNKKKLELEEKQRAVRRQREAEVEKAMAQGRDFEEYAPVWFTKTQDPLTGTLFHSFNGDYWECKDRSEWSRCPDIY